MQTFTIEQIHNQAESFDGMYSCAQDAFETVARAIIRHGSFNDAARQDFVDEINARWVDDAEDDEQGRLEPDGLTVSELLEMPDYLLGTPYQALDGNGYNEPVNFETEMDLARFVFMSTLHRFSGAWDARRGTTWMGIRRDVISKPMEMSETEAGIFADLLTIQYGTRPDLSTYRDGDVYRLKAVNGFPTAL